MQDNTSNKCESSRKVSCEQSVHRYPYKITHRIISCFIIIVFSNLCGLVIYPSIYTCVPHPSSYLYSIVGCGHGNISSLSQSLSMSISAVSEVSWLELFYGYKSVILVYLSILTFIQEYSQVKLTVLFLGQRIHVFKIAVILAKVAFKRLAF